MLPCKDYGILGFLPTFGPARVNLYSSKSGGTTLKKMDGSGPVDSFHSAAYKGNLLISLEVELLRESVLLPKGANVSPCTSLLKVSAGYECTVTSHG